VYFFPPHLQERAGNDRHHFQDLILTVCIRFISSLFVALTLVPALSAASCVWIPGAETVEMEGSPYARYWVRLYETKLEQAYAHFLSYFLRHRFLLIML
jgi:multidrug efflux pump subunit AcrB